MTFGGFVAMAVFLPRLLSDWFGCSTVDAGQRAAGIAALAVAARPIGGWLADRFGGGAVLVISLAGVAIDASGFRGSVAFAAVGLLVTLQILRGEAVARSAIPHRVAVR